MAGAGFSLGLNAFANAIEQMATKASGMQIEMLSAIGETLVASTQKRFEQGVGPDGTAWEPSNRADNTKRGKTLVNTKVLKNSISWATNGNEVHVGTNKEYARIHQLGGEITPKKASWLVFKIGGRTVRTRKVTIPARPYLGINNEDKIEIAALINDMLYEALK
jgi:phage virion morphogenesis protein